MNIVKRENRKGDKAYFTIEYGRENGERQATGIFIYTHPKSQVEKNHNKEALIRIDTRKSELLLEQQAIGTGYVPSHKFKGNFLDYYEEFARDNKRKAKRHLSNSLTQFRSFLGKTFISPADIPSILSCTILPTTSDQKE